MTTDIRDQAALWMARARDPRFSDWDALTEWLEADPAHNLAYEAAFAGHDLAGALASEQPAAPFADTRVASTWRRSRWIGGGLAGAVAAALVALVGLLTLAARQLPVRASALIWGGWTLVTGLTFSFMSGTVHPY